MQRGPTIGEGRIVIAMRRVFSIHAHAVTQIGGEPQHSALLVRARIGISAGVILPSCGRNELGEPMERVVARRRKGKASHV